MSRRARGEGSVYPDGNRWVASISYHDHLGRRQRRRRGAGTQADALERLNELREEQKRPRTIGARRGTLGDYLDGWLEVVAHVNRPRTHRAYSDQVRLHINPAIGRVALAKLEPVHVRRLLYGMAERDYSASTIQQTRRVLHRALEQAREDGLLTLNPVSAVRSPQARPRRRGEILTPEQARRFLEHVEGDRLAALYSVAIAIGLRQGEALGLRWQDIDFEHGVLTLSNQLQRVEDGYELQPLKTERSRRAIPLPEVVATRLRAHRDRQAFERTRAGDLWVEQFGLVFTCTNGAPLHRSTVYHHFRRQLMEAGLPPVTFHDLRRTAASFLAAQGVHPRVIMEILGHSRATLATEIYTLVSLDLQREAMAGVDALLR